MKNNQKIETGIYSRVDHNLTKSFVVRLKSKSGHWFPQKTFSRLQDAKLHKTKLLYERERGRHCNFIESQRITYVEYWEKWQSLCRTNISEGWRRDQDRIENSYIRSFLQNKKLQDVSPEDIRQILNNVARLGRKEQMQLHVYQVLHKCFEDAVEEFQLLVRNPVLRKFRPKVRSKERNFLREDEIVKLLNAAKGHYLEPALWLCCFLGLRASEVQALRWKHVTFTPPQVLIQDAYKKKHKRIEAFPKGGKPQFVSMPSQLTEFLRSKVKTDLEAFVVEGPNGGMLSYDTFYLGLKNLCRVVGLKFVTPHELRHSCTEVWVNFGATREDLSRILNQSSQKVVDRYVHRSSDRTARIANSIVLQGLGVEQTSSHKLMLVR